MDVEKGETHLNSPLNEEDVESALEGLPQQLLPRKGECSLQVLDPTVASFHVEYICPLDIRLANSIDVEL